MLFVKRADEIPKKNKLYRFFPPPQVLPEQQERYKDCGFHKMTLLKEKTGELLFLLFTRSYRKEITKTIR